MTASPDRPTRFLPILVAAALLTAASGPAVANWQLDGTPACAVPGDQTQPAVASDANGGCYVVWQDARRGETDLYGQHLDHDGKPAPGWPAGGLPICAVSGAQVEHRIVADGAGGVLVAWTDYRAGNTNIYVQRVMPDGSTAPGWPANGVNVSNTSHNDYRPDLISDQLGGAMVVFGRFGVDYSGFLVPMVVGSRVLAQGYIEPGCPDSGWVYEAQRTGQAYPRLAFDSSHGAVIAYQELNAVTAGAYDVWAVHYTRDFETYWDKTRAQALALPGNQTLPAVAGDGVGGFFIANTNGTIYVARLDGYTGLWIGGYDVDNVTIGNPYPATGGEMVSSRPAGHVWFLYDWAAPSGASGASIMRFDPVSEGVPSSWYRYPMPGANEDFQRTHLAADVSGGVYACTAGSDSRVYATHLNASESPAAGWPPTALRMSRFETPQRDGAIASDDQGNAFAAWAEVRNGGNGYDIYVQKLVTDGIVGVALALVSAEASFDRVTLTWSSGAANPAPAAVERRSGSGDWVAIARIDADGTGMYRYEDRDVAPGASYDYRLRSGATTSDVRSVTVPLPPRFALLGVIPEPTRDRWTIRFTLPAAEAAGVDIWDTMGRRVATRSLGVLGPGPHEWLLDEAATLRPGVYLIRLEAGGEHRVVRATRIR